MFQYNKINDNDDDVMGIAFTSGTICVLINGSIVIVTSNDTTNTTGYYIITACVFAYIPSIGIIDGSPLYNRLLLLCTYTPVLAVHCTDYKRVSLSVH